MTVTLCAKHDIAKSDDNGNETRCTGKSLACLDHTESLLDDLAKPEENESENMAEKLSDKELVKKPIKPKINEKDLDVDEDAKKYKRLYSWQDAPAFLKHNIYILSGYRGILDTKHCIESVFWWTNETINIWSHLFGFVLFGSLTFYDLYTVNVYAPLLDKIVVSYVLFCFQTCMILSSLYHTFSCRSEEDADFFLNFDLFGIALSLLAIYMSGIYYAFWCEQEWKYFYLISVTLIFMVAMLLQIPSFKINSNVKMLVFVAWAAYGVIPTVHWTIRLGGMDNPIVRLLLPRVLGMYAISGTAFVIYLFKIPERWSAGTFDYLGHSHQWWHIIVLAALYYWHSSGMIYVEYRMNHACAA